MNQYSEYFDLNSNDNAYGPSITDQMTVKKTIERDLQRQVQMMLGTMMGQDKVVVSVTTDIDFKLENREENHLCHLSMKKVWKESHLVFNGLLNHLQGMDPVAGGTPAGGRSNR